jgi:hypothetical protein
MMARLQIMVLEDAGKYELHLSLAPVPRLCGVQLLLDETKVSHQSSFKEHYPTLHPECFPWVIWLK